MNPENPPTGARNSNQIRNGNCPRLYPCPSAVERHRSGFSRFPSPLPFLTNLLFCQKIPPHSFDISQPVLYYLVGSLHGKLAVTAKLAPGCPATPWRVRPAQRCLAPARGGDGSSPRFPFRPGPHHALPDIGTPGIKPRFSLPSRLNQGRKPL